MKQTWYAVGSVGAVLVLGAVAAGAQQMLTPAGGSDWVGTWATAPMGTDTSDAVPVLAGHTLRQVVRTSVAGEAVRLRISNEFGTTPLTVEDVHVAMSAGGGGIEPGTDHTAAFAGQGSIVIPPGAFALTDPIAMQLPALGNVAVSLYLPVQQMGAATWHNDAAATSYIAPSGDVSGAASFTNPQTVQHWYFLKGIDVEAKGAASVAAFGDSITDGAYVQPDTNHRWPDFLADRLDKGGKIGMGVLDEGIGGNRVLHDGYGPNALARLDRDVIAQAGVRSVIVLESINDIGQIPFGADDPESGVTAQDLEQGLEQIVARAHEHGLKVYGGTLTPYEGAGYWSARGEQVREAVNQWIRTSGTFDGVVDFDKAVRDPDHPTRFLPKYDHGDHLHPSDAGYKAMADAIDLKLLE